MPLREEAGLGNTLICVCVLHYILVLSCYGEKTNKTKKQSKTVKQKHSGS